MYCIYLSMNPSYSYFGTTSYPQNFAHDSSFPKMSYTSITLNMVMQIEFSYMVI